MNWKHYTGIGVLALMVLATFGVVAVGHGNDVIEDGHKFAIVSSTEYWSGETGMVIGRLVDWTGDPISVINCTSDILYPNNTWFEQGQLMSTNLISGDHYHTFTTPEQEGVYDYSVTCYWTQGATTRSVSQSKTFHVNPALNFIKTINATQQDILLDLFDLNVSVDLVYTDTTYIRNNMVTNLDFGNNMTEIYTRFDNVDVDLDILKTYCDDGNTSGSQLCLLVTEIDSKLDSLNTTNQDFDVFLQEINQTTHSTYDYVTGTLASNVGTVLADLGILKTTTTQINDTVNTIQSNTTRLIQIEEDKVFLDIVS